MITRLLSLKDAVLESLANHSHNISALKDSEWTKLQVTQKLLSPCEKASELLGGEHYVTISVILPIIAYLKKNMVATDDDPGYAKKFKEGFWVDLTGRIDKIEANAYLQIATALDIRFKNMKCVEKNKRDGIWRLIQRLMSDVDIESEIPKKKSKQSSTATMFDFEDSESDDDGVTNSNSELSSDDTMVELTLYRSVPCETDFEKDPLIFWKGNEHIYPRLSKLAKQYLSMPATSVPVERLFSVAGELISKKRNSLNPENANLLLSLHC